ncbi:hypothetical protein ACM67B_06005 [Neisseria sp. CCUG17229]|uniref:hypothetical protein n=1 Tax=Neisseria sp. CCUG17229 TaxID=3392036 RepID=UPI003A0FF002
MPFIYEKICCQTPHNFNHVARDYVVVKAIFNNSNSQLERVRKKAWSLAASVNPYKANNATQPRERERLILDALGGVLAEEAWLYYLLRRYGKNAASFTPFNGANGQIDIVLDNGKSIEIRSSFPRNGIKFAICHERYNFKNICKYENLYKPSEADKDFFGCVLFETPKEKLNSDNEIVLYLIGGSTKAMMLDPSLSFRNALVAEGDLTEQKTDYQVVYLKDALDMIGFEEYMASMGYQKKQPIPLNTVF